MKRSEDMVGAHNIDAESMFTKMLIKEYLREAKDSFRIYVNFVGTTDSKANIVFLKWPDAMDSLVEGDWDKLRSDFKDLICVPIQSIAQALNSFAHNKLKIEKITERIEFIMSKALNDPIGTKKALIKICNDQIFILRSHGEKVDFIGDDHGY